MTGALGYAAAVDATRGLVLASAVVPLKEPDSVDVKVRLSAGIRPSQVQTILDHRIATPTKPEP